MIELSEQQRQELALPEPMAIDPKTTTKYILVRKEVYDRFKAQLGGDDYNPDESMALVNEAMADDDAHDPLLDSYQKYGKAP
jgi:hypothetical protein